MKSKTFVATLLSFVIPVLGLYAVGYLFDVDWLKFYYERRDDDSLEVGGSAIPFVVGLPIAYLFKRIHKETLK